jgi:hypothetical protein
MVGHRCSKTLLMIATKMSPKSGFDVSCVHLISCTSKRFKGVKSIRSTGSLGIFYIKMMIQLVLLLITHNIYEGTYV